MTRRASLWLSLGWVLAYGQLSGTINQYAAVTAFLDPSNIQVDDGSLFSPGDRILVYQAKGATINTSNNASYGDITEIGGAGLFEFATLQAVSGNTLTLTCALTRPFNTADPVGAAIQVVRVSYHTGNITLTGIVTAPAWDGAKGGIVVIETEGTLTFNADIDVRGQGFRGGSRSMDGGNTWDCVHSTYHGSPGDQAGRKGEGIANWPGSNHLAYRGKLANGGGGGNNHNTGGAGGGNYGAGGTGGWTTCGSRVLCPGSNVTNCGYGLGGAALSSYLNASSLRLFFGGGGGGGHQNNNQGGNGGNGGGIVLLRAAQIVGNGRQILARGTQGIQNLGSGCNRNNVSFAGNDGGSGGGAGGAVALFCTNYAGTLTIDARGAGGQNCSSHLCSCRPDHGPGGGGGGGYVAFSMAATPPGVTLLLAGGTNGTELTPVEENMNGCNNTGCGSSCINCISAGPDRINRGATPGAAGGTIYNLSWDPYSPCPLAALALVRWTLTPLPTGLRHQWELRGPTERLEALSVEVSAQSGAVQTFSLPPIALGEAIHALQPGSYTFTLWARAGGSQTPLSRQTFTYAPPLFLEGQQLTLSWPEAVPFALYDAAGRTLLQGTLEPHTHTTLSTASLPQGLYLLQIGTQSYRLLLP